MKGYRWTVCALVFLAMTVNYMDRQLFSILVPYFENDLRLGPTDLALVNVSFILPYGFAMLFVGRAIDRVGVRKGLGVSFLVWNLASMAHALVRGLGGFMVARFALGLGESGMFPSAVKTATEWFPVRERSTATGFFNAAANLGAIFAPLLGVLIAERYGWRACFFLTGLLGMVWLFFWNRMYRAPREHPRVLPEELALIEEDVAEVPERGIGYAELFGMRSVYALALAKTLSDAPWWFYLFWLPKYLVDGFGISKGAMALAVAFVYIVADVGSIGGGMLSSRLIARGRGVGPARKTAMLVCALLATPVALVGLVHRETVVLGLPGVDVAVGLIALAAAAHQGWSSNLFTLISDTVPKPAVAMAVGAINGFGMVGTSAMQFFVGWSVALTGAYVLPFALSGALYLVALLAVQLILPQVRQSVPTRRANLGLVALGALGVLALLGFVQYTANKPPYPSTGVYLARRGGEIGASGPALAGPPAKVGWMSARWYRWPLAKGGTKLDLVKLDRYGHPFVDGKGVLASHYDGPSEARLATGFGAP